MIKQFIKFTVHFGPKHTLTLRAVAAQQRNPARGGRSRRAPLRPGHNLGLGREFPFPPGPLSVRALPTVGCHRTVRRAFRPIKIAPRPPAS